MIPVGMYLNLDEKLKMLSPLGDLWCLSCEESFRESFLVHRLTFKGIYSRN